MNVISAVWILCFTLGQLMPPVAAAEPPSELSCTVEPQPDGTVVYQLSRATRSSSCQPGWEDRNKTALALDSSFHLKLVHNLTSRSITMKHCQDFLHYSNGCLHDFEETDCSVNCTLLLLKDPPVPAVNSTSVCWFEGGCSDLKTTGVILCIFIAALVSLGLYCCFKRRCGPCAALNTSYTPANEKIQIVMEGVEVVQV